MKHCLTLLTVLTIAGTACAEEVSRCYDVPTSIPDGDLAGLVIPLDFDIAPRVVTGARVELELTHAWTGDLVLTLTAPGGAVPVVLMERPGQVGAGFPGPFGCGGDDINATFIDSAAVAIDDACTFTAQPVFGGDLRADEPLSVLDGLDPEGVWTITLSDVIAGDAGTLVRVCVVLDVEEDCDRDGTPDSCTCVSDFNGDGLVDIVDFGVFGSAFGASTGDANFDARADFNNDGLIDIVDFGTFGAEFNRNDCSIP